MQRLDIAVAAYAKAIELDPRSLKLSMASVFVTNLWGVYRLQKKLVTVLKIKADSAGALKNLSVISANSGTTS